MAHSGSQSRLLSAASPPVRLLRGILCAGVIGLLMGVHSLPGQTRFYEHAHLNALEQVFLERVNQARANPLEESIRFGIGLNDGLPAGSLSAKPKQPLAPNSLLSLAAWTHADWMLRMNTFSHSGEAGSTPRQRIEHSGYLLIPPWITGENLARASINSQPTLSTNVEARHRDLFLSADHRKNLLNPEFEETGIAIVEGQYFTTPNLMLVQKFAISAASDGPYILGVVYADHNGNGQYDAGEGIGGVRIDLSSGEYHTESSPAGGYALPLPDSREPITVTFSGKDLVSPHQVIVEAQGGNLRYNMELLGANAAWQTLTPFGNGGLTRLTESGWMQNWWGLFHAQGNGWHLHRHLGWAYIQGSELEGFWMWQPGGEWIWTRATHWPWFYRHSSQSWHYFHPAEHAYGYWVYSQNSGWQRYDSTFP